MKRLLVLIIVLSLLVLGGTLVSAEGKTRRHRSKFGRKSRTAAIVAGGAGVGALVGGTKGAAIGAGGAGMYAFNRKAARRHFKGRTAGTVLSGTSLGAGVGGAAGGKRAAAVGAAAGAGGSYLYSRHRRHRRY